MIALLLVHNASLVIHDTMWNGAPYNWTVHCKQPRARDRLREAEASSA